MGHTFRSRIADPPVAKNVPAREKIGPCGLEHDRPDNRACCRAPATACCSPMQRRSAIALSVAAAIAGGAALAQGIRIRTDDGDVMRIDDHRELPGSVRHGVPEWEAGGEFKNDVFTFARVKYDSGGWRGGGKWLTDWPDSDLNFSYRLQQLTSMEVDPDGAIVELTDPELFKYPFIYMVEPGDIWLSDEEAANLRKYLLNGGFLMVDDFWGYREWDEFYRAIKKVFPDREPEELPIEHPIFHCVFDLTEKPQVPSIGVAIDGRYEGITYEWGKPGAEKVSFKGITDDQGRLMCLICWNTDLGDGWEREGEDEWYFREFAEKKAYPMGINIVFYALTH